MSTNKLPKPSDIEQNYLKQLNLEHPWRIFFWANEIDWLNWQELQESLTKEGQIYIHLTELDNMFNSIKCPKGFILVGASRSEKEPPIYGFVKVE